LLAAACEMVWPLGFKYTNGFKIHYWAIGLTFGVMILSFWLMSLAIGKGIPMGTAYAVWTGVGAAGIAVLGMIFFKEPSDLVRIGCLFLIIAGVVGLKFLSPHEKPDAPATQPSLVSSPSEGSV